MSTSTATIRDRFSSEAGNWDRLYETSGATSVYEHNLWHRRETALAFIGSPEGRILDVGCGPGNVTTALPQTADVVGTDFAIPMLRTAKDAAREADKPVALTASDATSLPFPDGTFNTVLALGLMEYIADTGSILEEVGRVTAPEGTLVLSLPNAWSPFIIIDDALKASKNTLTQVLMPPAIRRRLKALLGKEDIPYFTHRRHRFKPSQIIKSINALGFHLESWRYHTYGFGVLNHAKLNLSLCKKLESFTRTHPNLEKLGWTIVMKAKKRS